MSLADQLNAMGKRLDEAIDGVLAEQISATAKLDDLDFQISELRDMLGQVLALLEPEDDSVSP